jgi:hypothetical protein
MHQRLAELEAVSSSNNIQYIEVEFLIELQSLKSGVTAWEGIRHHKVLLFDSKMF